MLVREYAYAFDNEKKWALARYYVRGQEWSSADDCYMPSPRNDWGYGIDAMSVRRYLEQQKTGQLANYFSYGQIQQIEGMYDCAKLLAGETATMLSWAVNIASGCECA